MINSLANILPINVVGVVSGTAASGTPTDVFSWATVQNVVIINEDPIEVNLVGSGVSGITLQSAYDSGDGSIVTAAGKPLNVTGSGIFTDDLSVDGDTFIVDTSTNRVGIGTNTPQKLLSLQEATKDAELRIEALSPFFPILEFRAAGRMAYFLRATADNRFAISSTFVEDILVLDPLEGFVGINTAFPTEHLHVVGSGIFTGGLEIQGNPVILSGLSTASGSLDAGELWVDVSDNHALRITPS